MVPDSGKGGGEDPLFSGRGAPAFMSLKEPALMALKERYEESFALTLGKERAHLFLVKLGLWALVWTITKKDSAGKELDLGMVLQIVGDAASGKNPGNRERLDASVSASKERVRKKLSEFSSTGQDSL